MDYCPKMYPLLQCYQCPPDEFKVFCGDCWCHIRDPKGEKGSFSFTISSPNYPYVI